MSKSGNTLEKDSRSRARVQEQAENALRPARQRGQTSSAPPEEEALTAKGKVTRADKRPAPVPEAVRSRFVQVKNAYFFPDGARAFTDRGDRLTTPSENREVVRSLVAIAEARGWGEVVVSGTERFRREAWVAARTAGLEVRGYEPTQFEKERLGRALQSAAARPHTSPQAAPSEETTPARDRSVPDARNSARQGLLRGTLIEHGRAPYQNNSREPESYFVRLETARGERTIWGVDLERALRQSLSQPVAGDRVALRSLGQEPVTVKSAQRDESGRLVGERELAVHRNRWTVETEVFLQGRAQAAVTLRDASIDPRQATRQHPELAGTYLQVRAAELAARQIRDPLDQKRFVEKVREALAVSVARGDPLPPVRLREDRAAEQGPRPLRAPERAPARA